MTDVLNHTDGVVFLEPASDGKIGVRVEMTNEGVFCPITNCKTSYGIDLIRRILNTKGPAYLCDEIMRDEDPDYVQKHMHYDILSYLDQNIFSNKKMLDFGCGSGASTMILHRMFPNSEIVGVELESSLIDIARLRADHYRTAEKVKLLLSPSGDELPNGIGSFDYIFLNAVYEHLLPSERRKVLALLWDSLNPGGVLFINQTPFRWFPIETHTTSGLPLINYLPDRIALHYAKRMSKRKLHDVSWDELLRLGIRGGSVGEILEILDDCEGRPKLLEPRNLGMKDRIDMWFAVLNQSRRIGIKKSIYYVAKAIKGITGVILLPTLALAIEKGISD